MIKTNEEIAAKKIGIDTELNKFNKEMLNAINSTETCDIHNILVSYEKAIITSTNMKNTVNISIENNIIDKSIGNSMIRAIEGFIPEMRDRMYEKFKSKCNIKLKQKRN